MTGEKKGELGIEEWKKKEEIEKAENLKMSEKRV